MNLLEHYISEIHSEKLDGKYIVADITVNCYGAKKRIVNYFTPEEWETVKKQGYYMA